MEKLTRRRFSRTVAVGAAGVGAAMLSQPLDCATIVSVPVRAMTRGPRHHWFGYYDKCPVDRTGRYLLAHASDFAARQPRPGEPLTLGVVDLDGATATLHPLATTTAWSWQQGAQLQWLGPSFDREIVFNTHHEGRPRAARLDVATGEVRYLPLTVYAVSLDGTQAVTTDYARLHRMHPGYGYIGDVDKYSGERAPSEVGLWHIDLATGRHALVVSLRDLAKRRADSRMIGADHSTVHARFNLAGTRLAFLHRWQRVGDRTPFTRVYTAEPDGSDLRLHLDTSYASHFDWRDDETILLWARIPGKANAFFTLDVRTDAIDASSLGALTEDGHCSYSPDRAWIVTDTYPSALRMQTLSLCEVVTGRRYDLAPRFYSPPMFTGPVRCDLHPRWSHDGTQVYVDGSHEAQRQIYAVDVTEVVHG